MPVSSVIEDARVALLARERKAVAEAQARYILVEARDPGAVEALLGDRIVVRGPQRPDQVLGLAGREVSRRVGQRLEERVEAAGTYGRLALARRQDESQRVVEARSVHVRARA